MYLTHGSRAGSVEGFGDRDGRRGARGTEDHREVRGIGDSSESLVGSDPGDIAEKQQPRTCRADAAPHDGRRPGRGQEGAGCQRRFPVITARSMECASEPGVIVAGAGALPRARRRCEAGKRTHGPGTRACLALLAATALLALAAPAQAQTEMVPADWALKPADLGAGEQFRLMFVSSTTRDATSTDIADYNTFVRTRAAAGVTAIQTYANDFTALVSTESVNARTNTLTRATDTDVPIYRARSGTVSANDRVADDYADFYDGTWPTSALGYDESGTLVNIGLLYFWTGMNVDGTTHATEFMGASSLVRAWNVSASTVGSTNRGSSTTQRIVALSPVFQVAGGTPNTAPTAEDKTVTTGEDRAYAFTADDFGFDDDDAGATLASVTIVTVPAAGTLALDGTAVMADDVVTAAEIDGDMLTFTPVLNAHGDPYTTFTFTVNDGTDDSASAYTMTIDVTDAPLPVCAAPSFGDRREIWTGTVTVGTYTFLASTLYGYSSTAPAGALDDQTFTIGSNDYTIARARVALGGSNSGQLAFELLDGQRLTTVEVEALRLHVCGEDYDFSGATTLNASYWSTTLDWSPPVVTRTVYLSLPANHPATGEPAITGTAQAGQELTADASPIMDTDGLASVSYSYQWVRVDADGTSNEEAISGEIAATYTLTAADVGKKIKVQVSFTDELSGLETRTSAAYPSSGTVTAASTTAPALLSVTVTSTPHKTTDTYGAREHIEFSMTFDASVTVTGAPTFAFDLGGASTATYYAGSGTATLRFSHAVSGGSSGDEDTNGISWAENAIALNGGTIAGTDNEVAAILTHVAQSNLPAHKVDGRTTPVTPATVTVAVTSTPTSLADTYGFGETIVITVTASEAVEVEVEGDPVFRFSLTNSGGAANDVPATYDRTRSSATTMVFTYTVQAGDMDNNGIWIGDHSRTFMLDVNDRIRTASQQIDIDRSHPEKSTHADHKVNGSLGAPTVPPDPTAPTLVLATATTLTIEWTHPGDGGSPLTRNFIEYRVEGTTDWTNWYRGATPTPVTRTVIRNLQAETAYDVRVHSTNAIGNSQWTQSATAFSTLAGTAATGAPAITGTAAVGQPLAVDLTGIADADGLTNVSYSYQWVRVDADGLSNPADITDATDATYTVVYADLGKTLKVRVTFDDDGGNTETRTSAATATVTPAAGAPGSPSNLSATVGVGQVVLVWQHTRGSGGTRSSYEYRSSAGAMISPDAMWQQVQTGPGALNTAYYQVVKGLTSGTIHTLQVRAVNPQGGSAPATVTVTPLSQPSCTIDALGDRRRLWQGQLTAGVRNIGTDGNIETGYGDGGVETGTLTPAAFTFRSTSYSVYPRTSDDLLTIVIREQDIDVWFPREEVVDALRMHVCNTSYDFSNALEPNPFGAVIGHRWNVGSIWPPGIERTLRLSLPPNHAATGDPVISGTVQVGEELTALTDGIMDEDVLDDVFTYQWVRVDADGTSNEEDITDETDATYTLTADDRGKQVKVEVRFVDILGGEETRTSAPTATLAGVPNTAATGAPTITGTAQVGETLTAVTTGIMDADGLTSVSYSYQWIRVDADGTSNPADITDETDATYTLVDADLGKKIKVRVTFVDDASHTETLTSAATATVGAVATGPPTVNDVAVTSTPASGTTYYLAGEVIEFTVTFSAPVTVTATPKFAFRLGAATRQAAYASGSESAALVFARTVQAGEVDRNGISWNALALALDGGTITQTGATTAAILTHAEQAPLEGHRVDAAPPMQVSASVHGMSLVLVYDEPLDPASMPATGAYTVTATVGATTTNPAVSEVSIYGIWVTLALDAAPAAGATVTLAYAPPTSNPVQDEAGNDAPAFSGQSVNGAAGNTAPTGAPTITGTAQVGQTLTASTTGIADADGLTSPTYTYQWIRVDGTDEADIASENSSTYTLVDADLGKTLKVRVTFDDDASHTETLTSAATATVGAVATGPPTVTDVAVTSTPASGTTYYLAGEVIEFTVTFSAPVTVTATPKFAFRLGAATRQAAYASGSGSAALVFARTVQAGEVDRNGISWNALALALDGGTITQTGATTAARLTHAEQAPLEGHRVDAAPPMQVSASVQGMSLVLVYDEPLDPASMPATGAYTVTATVGATTTNPAVSEVSIYGIWVTLTLDAAPAAGATVTLAYAPPASNPVQDEAGNDAPAFSGQSVRLGPPPPSEPLEQVLGVGVVPGNAQLVVIWTAVSTATGYTVQWTSGGQGYNTGDRQATVTSGSTTRYTIPSLTNGTPYTVRVIATRTGANDGPPSAEVTGTPTVPDLEQVLGVGVAPGNAQLVVTWTAVDNATGYTVQWTSSGQGYNTGDRQATVTSGSTTRYTIPSLTNGTEYTVRVIATRTGATDGPPSAGVKGTPTVPPPPPVTDLAQVMGVGVAPGNAQLVVTWTAVSTATGYTVQWMSSGQGYNTGDRQATVTTGSITRYTIPSLTNGTEYTVRVIATRTGATDGPPSDEMTGTPRVPPPPPPPPVTDLEQVLGVGVAPGNAQLVVTWTAVDNATGYTVQWMSSGQGYNTGDRQATVTPGSTTRYTIPSLTNGTEYTVRVIATRTGADDGPPSDEVTGTPFTTPGAPQHLRGEPGDAQVTLTWDAPSSDGGSAILRYEYAIDDSGTWIDAGLDLEETVPGLTNGQQYAFEVRAVNSAGPGAPARTAATPLGMPSVPESLTATGGDGAVVLEWTEPADDGGSPVTGYEYRYAAGQAVPEDVTWRDAGTELTATVSGLENETRYTFEVRARNRVGPGETSGTTALPLRLRAELFSSAAAEGEALVLGVRRSGRLAFPAHAYIGVTDSALPGVTATEEGRDDGLGRQRLEFAAGAAEATVTVTVAFDGERRQDRVLSATLDYAELEVDGVRRPYELVTPTLVVPVTEGDAGLSVADARVEGKSSVLAFTVSLDRTRDVAVRVDYATEDGAARAGEDYTPVSGTLTIEAGGRERTVEVPVLPALHVTGERTLTLRLSNAVSAVIDDGVATGVIVRESELPKAWLARFGRTASDHAAQAIARRLEAGQRETQVTVAGRRVDGLSVDGLLLGVLPSGGWRPASAVEDMATRLAAPALAASGAPFGGVGADPGTPGLRAGTWGGAPGALDRESSADAGQTLRRAVLPDFGYRLPGAEEALLGTSFYVERGAQQDVGGGTWAAWGDVAATRFEGDAGGLALDGDVVTGTAGLDRQWRAVLVGLALSRSSGEGGYGTGAGTIASTLTSVHPYVQVRFGERAQVWGAAGWGRGGLEITPESGAALEADLTNTMGALGGRAVLMGAGGLEIALRSDFLWTETSSDGTAALAEAVGTASRGRLMLEGAGQIQGLGGVVRPKVEGGVRYDGGDAETGQGFEVGGGLDWARGSLTLQVNGRMLVAHADESYEEWGYSGSLVYEPGADGMGLQMRVGSSAGAAASGIRNLWALENASGLVRGGAVPFAQRFDAEVGYGLGRGTLWYPYFVADDSGRTRYGLKLSSGRTIGVGLEFGRRKSVDLGPEDAMLLRGELRF